MFFYLLSLAVDSIIGPCYITGHNTAEFICGSSREREYRLMKGHSQLTFCQCRSTSAPRTARFSAVAPVSFITRLSNWRPLHADHAAPPIVDVPLAQDKQVYSVDLSTVAHPLS